jgi:hypothetical protein
MGLQVTLAHLDGHLRQSLCVFICVLAAVSPFLAQRIFPKVLGEFGWIEGRQTFIFSIFILGCWIYFLIFVFTYLPDIY